MGSKAKMSTEHMTASQLLHRLWTTDIAPPDKYPRKRLWQALLQRVEAMEASQVEGDEDGRQKKLRSQT